MSYLAWEAGVLPLNYARALTKVLAFMGFARKRAETASENKRRSVAVVEMGLPRGLPRVFSEGSARFGVGSALYAGGAE